MNSIIEFFRNLFASLFGGSKPSTTPNTSNPPTVDTTIDTPKVDTPSVPESTIDTTVHTPDAPRTEEEIDTNLPEVEVPDIDTSIPTVDEPVITSPITETSSPVTTNPTTVEDGLTTEAQDGSEVKPNSNIVVEDESGVEDENIGTPDIPAIEFTPIDLGDEVPVETTAGHIPRYMWCLDNGHGSKTAGKRSPKLADGRQLLEYEFNRDVVKRIAKALKRHGVEHYIVVPEDNVDNFLEERVNRANRYNSDVPKLFVSVHSNAAPAPPGRWCNPSIEGVETWYYHNSTRGKKLAAIFQKHLVAETGLKNRHIKSRPAKQFYVLRKTGMTAILTENGFYNNKEECKQLLTDEMREKVANAHIAAILEIEEQGFL